MQLVVMTSNVGLLSGKSQRTPALGLTGSDDVGRTPRSTCATATKLPSHGSMLFFYVSCGKKSLRGKAIGDEERSKVTPHSNLYRCTKRTTGGASSSGRASGISLSKLKGSGSEGISA